MLAEACRRAGIEPIGWHALRHSFASELIRRGASVFSVKELLGHQDVEVTMRYAHLNQDSLDESVLLLDRTRSLAAGAQPTPPTPLPLPPQSEHEFAKTKEKVVLHHDFFSGFPFQRSYHLFPVTNLSQKEGYGEDIRPIPFMSQLVEQLVESEFN